MPPKSQKLFFLPLNTISILFCVTFSWHSKPSSPSVGSSDVITFLLSEAIVLPQIAKAVSSKAENAQKINEMDIQSVLPDLTAPSHIIASRFLYGDDGHHQVSAVSCFSENGLNLL